MSTYTFINRHGSSLTFLLNEDKDLVLEGDLDFTRYGYLSTDEVWMVDPPGGPYIKLGMEAKLFHPDIEGKLIGKIVPLEENKVKLVLIDKGKGEQRELLKQMMEDDERDGIYED